MQRTWRRVTATLFAVGLFASSHVGSLVAQGNAVLEGVVFDSTSMKVLPGARVAAIGTNAMTQTDGSGRFRLTGLPPGSYFISFFHARLQELGVSAPSKQVSFTGDETRRIELAVPSEQTLLLGWCLAEQPRPGYAVLAGTVTDELTGVPMPSAVVTARPISRDIAAPQPVEVRTNDSGYFRICSLRPDVDWQVQAHFGKSNGRSVEMALAPGTATIEDLVLMMSAEGTLAGYVRDYATGEPIVGAKVSVLGTGSATLTDPTGRFMLDDLPPGRHLVTTEHLALEERTDSVTIFSEETVDIEVRMATEALEVEGLIVTARTRFGRTSLAGDAKRADFITREQIEVMLPRVAGAVDILRNMNTPGLRIRDVMVEDPMTGVRVPSYCIEVSRRSGGEGCQPVAVALNDILVPYPDQLVRDMDPNNIDRIEVLSPVDAVFQFGARGGNGAILIYTR